MTPRSVRRNRTRPKGRSLGRSQQALCCFTDSESWHPDALDDVVARHRGTAGKHVTRPLNHAGEHGTHTETRLPPPVRIRLIYQMYTYLAGAQPVVCRHPSTGRWPRCQWAPAEDLAHPAPFRSDAHAVSTRSATPATKFSRCATPTKRSSPHPRSRVS